MSTKSNNFVTMWRQDAIIELLNPSSMILCSCGIALSQTSVDPCRETVITASNHQALKALQVQGLSPDTALCPRPYYMGQWRQESPEDILSGQHKGFDKS